MDLETQLRKTNTGQQPLLFLGQKIWSNMSLSTNNVKATASFTHALKREMRSQAI